MLLTQTPQNIWKRKHRHSFSLASKINEKLTCCLKLVSATKKSLYLDLDTLSEITRMKVVQELH